MQIEDNQTIPRPQQGNPVIIFWENSKPLWVSVPKRPKLVEALSRGVMRWNPSHKAGKGLSGTKAGLKAVAKTAKRKALDG